MKEDLPDSEAGARDLLSSLMLCREPLFSPEGKPTCFELETNELNKRFGLSEYSLGH